MQDADVDGINIPPSLMKRWMKTKSIHEEVRELEKIRITKKTELSLTMAIFLIKSQWVEFAIKNLISTIDRKISNDGDILLSRYKKIKYMPLGKLQYLLEDFQPRDIKARSTIKRLLDDIKIFSNFRNKYTHHLFYDDTSSEEIVKELEKGISMCEEILKNVDALLEMWLPNSIQK